jgi:hypothetical protein
MKSTMKLDGIAMIIRGVVWQKGYFKHKQRNTSCIVIVDLKFHTKRRRAKIFHKRRASGFFVRLFPGAYIA